MGHEHLGSQTLGLQLGATSTTAPPGPHARTRSTSKTATTQRRSSSGRRPRHGGPKRGSVQAGEDERAPRAQRRHRKSTGPRQLRTTTIVGRRNARGSCADVMPAEGSKNDTDLGTGLGDTCRSVFEFRRRGRPFRYLSSIVVAEDDTRFPSTGRRQPVTWRRQRFGPSRRSDASRNLSLAGRACEPVVERRCVGGSGSRAGAHGRAHERRAADRLCGDARRERRLSAPIVYGSRTRSASGMSSGTAETGAIRSQFAGYRIRSVGAAKSRRLVILLVERVQADPASRPTIRYRPTSYKPVESPIGGQAVAQLFRGVRSHGHAPKTPINNPVQPAPPPQTAPVSLDGDGDGTPDATDCAPRDASIHPGAPDAPDLLSSSTPTATGVDGTKSERGVRLAGERQRRKSGHEDEADAADPGGARRRQGGHRQLRARGRGLVHARTAGRARLGLRRAVTTPATGRTGAGR